SDHRCRFNKKCEINEYSRKYCSYCRLQKCWMKNMKVDLIRTENEKRIRKQQQINNSTLKIINNVTVIYPLNLLNNDKSRLSQADWSYLSNMTNTYNQYCLEPSLFVIHQQQQNIITRPFKYRIKLQSFIDLISLDLLSLRTFFRHIPEFHNLSINTKTCLTQRNLRHLTGINAIDYLRTNCAPWQSVDLMVFQYVYGDQLLMVITEALESLRVVLFDPIMIRLLLIILIFSTSLSITSQDSNFEYQSESSLVNSFQIQNYYIKLLWYYMEYRFGEQQAVRMLSIIILHCLHSQNIGYQLDQHFQQRHDLYEMLESIRLTDTA
ncbi:unnamed protein product, partial [Didymodactylos carnosus]